METNRAPRILITRLSHIGDCILTLPVLTTLRQQYPDALIVWAVQSPTNKLLELHPDLDDVVVIPKGWIKKPGCWKGLREKLRSYNFDISIDPQGISKSAAVAWISGAKKRVGLSGKWGREISTWLNNLLVEPNSPHIVKRSVQMLEKIDVTIPGLDKLTFGLPVCENSLASVREQLDQCDVGQRFVVINPGGTWHSKRWEMERFGSVASYLKRHHDTMSVVVWAGEEELAMAEEIHKFDPTASVVAPKTDLKELAALSSEAMFFIGGDTGPLHLASAMGTPVIGLYGTTNSLESGAYGNHHIAIQKWFQSGSCRKRRKADNDAMRDILAADVFSACDQMFEKLKVAVHAA